MVRDHHRTVAAQYGDTALTEAVEQVAPTVYELSELLVDVLGVTDVGAYFPHRVTYHPTCHSLRMLRVGDRPLRLLRAVKGIDLVELPAADSCCGFGGTFALKNADVSNAMLADKMRHVLDTGAEFLTMRRQLLSHAHRRRPVPAPHRRRDTAPGRDPGLHGRGLTVSGADNVVWLGTPAFPEAAREALADTRLRANLRRATGTIRDKRLAVAAELDDWEELRETAATIKRRTLRHLDHHLLRLEKAVTAAGGTVHWAADAAEANRIVTGLVEATGEKEVVKVKSMATQEIGLNEALADAGIRAYETDLAELIVQLGGDRPSHILVPAIHRGRSEIREIFRREMGEWGRPAPRPSPTTRATSPKRPGSTCARSSCGPRWPSPVPTSPPPTPARWWSWSRRATGGCA